MVRSVFLNRGLICTGIAKIRADPGSAYRYDVMLERRSILIVLLSSPETVAAALLYGGDAMRMDKQA